MRIVFLRSNPISPDSRVEKEAESLVQDGHKVTVLAWDRSESYDSKEIKIKNLYGYTTIIRFGIPAVFGAGLKNLAALYKFQKATYDWLIKNKEHYDVIHACDLDNGLVASKVVNKTKKVFVYDVFDYYSASHDMPFHLSPLVSNIENGIISKADATIICSEQRIKQISGSKPNKLVILHNAPHQRLIQLANENFSIKKTGISNRTKIGYVGILSRARLIEEMIKVVKKRDDLELHIGGFGQLNDYLVEESRECDRIIFYGKLPYPDTLKLEQQMDILTAIYDPEVENHKYAAPNKFYEALMLGKPLIMVHNTGMDYIVDKYRIGATIDFTEESLCNGIDSIIFERDRWDDICSIEKKMFNELYSWEIMGKRLQDLYRELENDGHLR